MELVDRIQELSKRIEQLKQDQAEARGVQKNVLKSLKDEFGISSIEEARSLLKKREAKLKKMETELQEGLTSFEKKYGDLL